MAHAAEEWIRMLGLEPHPEGGCFRETYRARGTLEPHDRPGCSRPYATSILYLLRAHEVSRLHRLRSDELFHFHAGSPLTVHRIDGDGRYQADVLGSDPSIDQRLQLVVPAGTWFGATVESPGAWSLVGCTVAPGFDFADLEIAERSTLVRRYPQHRAIVERLTE